MRDKMDNKSSIGIKIFAYLLIIIGSLLLLLEVVIIVDFINLVQTGRIRFNMSYPLHVAVSMWLFIIFLLITGIGLLKLKPWARFLIIAEAIYFSTMSVGSVFGDIGIPFSGFPDDSYPWAIWALPFSISSSIFCLFVIWVFTRRRIKGQFKPIAILERNKIIMLLTVTVLLFVSIIKGIFLSCSHRELWARLFRDYGTGTQWGIAPSPFHLFALNICQFIRFHKLLVVLVISILCFDGAVVILSKDKYRRIK